MDPEVSNKMTISLGELVPWMYQGRLLTSYKSGSPLTVCHLKKIICKIKLGKSPEVYPHFVNGYVLRNPS